MAIKLSNNTFTIIPEGKTNFKIAEVNYDETFGKMTITLVTKEGLKQVERYNLLNNNGEYNDGAIKAFSYFSRTAMLNANIEEINPKDLVGKFITATVVHTKAPSNKDANKTVTFVNLKGYEMCRGFDVPSKAPVDIDVF